MNARARKGLFCSSVSMACDVQSVELSLGVGTYAMCSSDSDSKVTSIKYILNQNCDFGFKSGVTGEL